MQKLFASLLGILVAALFSVMPAQAEGKQNFTLKNKTGYTISEVYVSPTKSSSWEEDILGRDTLADADRVDIEFHRAAKACKWDVKVVYDDGEEAEWEGFDLCEVSTISIFYDRKKGTTWAEYE